MPRRPAIYLRRSSDGGATWAAEQLVRGIPGRAERPAIALTPDGEPVVVWQEIRAAQPFDVLAQVIGVDAEPVNVSRPGKSFNAANPVDTRSALSKQPYERHASAAAFAASLCEAVGEPLPISLRLAPPSRSEPNIALEIARAEAPTSAVVTGAAPRWSTRSMLVSYGAAFVLAVVGATLAYGSLSRSKPSADVVPVATATDADVPVSPAPSAAVEPQPSALGVPSSTTPPSAPALPAAPPRAQPKRPAAAAPSAQRPAGPASSVARTPGF